MQQVTETWEPSPYPYAQKEGGGSDACMYVCLHTKMERDNTSMRNAHQPATVKTLIFIEKKKPMYL